MGLARSFLAGVGVIVLVVMMAPVVMARLLQAVDKEAEYLARCLIDSEKAILKSKQSFISEMQRAGIKPKKRK